MSNHADAQVSLELVLKDEIIRMYNEVAEDPDAEFHFYHGRGSSFAGVGNPHERADLREGETVLDLGSGAGLDAIIASWAVGSWKVIGVDIHPAMCGALLEGERRWGPT